YTLSFTFCYSDTATAEMYTPSLHDALPIYDEEEDDHRDGDQRGAGHDEGPVGLFGRLDEGAQPHRQCALVGPGHDDERVRELVRSEEHTSELQSRENLVCRLLLEKKNMVEL